ncbi:Apple domain-containing protein [Madurella fahalii]|uniref:Apple domain-containing protein n=1 Tax=Madurella fahalii TaxID=1157608 RepID=A0ABQ0GPA8_9PEZI
MLPRGLLAVERARVHRRQNIAPCPRGNGTTIGTFQEFTVLCNTNLEGDVLDRLDAFDFTACVDLCSSFHPKCEGASFDGSRCTLRAGIRPEEQRRSRRTESAIGSFPGASSNCVTLSGDQQALGTSFTPMCGFIIAGNDIVQNFAPTFQDCLGQCAATSGCAALSFDPSQDLGFKNCYLKTAVANPNDIAADQRTDSAMVVNAAENPPNDPPPASSAGPGVVPGPVAPPTDPGVSTIPVPPPSSTPTAGAGNGVVFFTPPAGSSATEPAPPAASTVAPAPDSSPTPTDAVTTPSSSVVIGAPPFFFPSAGTTPASSDQAAPETAGQDSGDATSTNAWIAAPVVGSIAAIALIAVTFTMLKRRRRGNGDGGRKIPDISRPWPISSLFTSWLPGSSSSRGSRGDSGGSSRKMTGMGNFSVVNSRQQGTESRASVRDSVAGFLTGRPAGMERLEDIEEGDGRGGAEEAREKKDTPVYEVKNGRVELRNSLNGLGQNRWS